MGTVTSLSVTTAESGARLSSAQAINTATVRHTAIRGAIKQPIRYQAVRQCTDSGGARVEFGYYRGRRRGVCIQEPSAMSICTSQGRDGTA